MRGSGRFEPIATQQKEDSVTPDMSAQADRRAALIDLALIIAVLLISKSLLLEVAAIWTYAGPISLLIALGVATVCLRRRGKDLASVGLKRPDNLKKAALWTIIALVLTMGVGMVAESLFTAVIGAPDEATQAIDERFQGRFDNLPGNLPVYLFWLALAWVIGAFTEEVLFRGVLFSKFEQAFAGVPLATLLAVLCQAVLFGQAHYYYQGLAGWVATGAIAFVSGALYLVFRRNLWPLMLSHGLSNTLGLTLLYLGVI
jgi:membrane protease YdiL (CAAX protease family)